MEFSPAGMYCQNRCVYCWRPMEFYESMEMDPNKVAEPKDILTKLLVERTVRLKIKTRYRTDACLWRGLLAGLCVSGDKSIYAPLLVF